MFDVGPTVLTVLTVGYDMQRQWDRPLACLSEAYGCPCFWPCVPFFTNQKALIGSVWENELPVGFIY